MYHKRYNIFVYAMIHFLYVISFFFLFLFVKNRSYKTVKYQGTLKCIHNWTRRISSTLFLNRQFHFGTLTIQSVVSVISIVRIFVLSLIHLDVRLRGFNEFMHQQSVFRLSHNRIFLSYVLLYNFAIHVLFFNCQRHPRF